MASDFCPLPTPGSFILQRWRICDKDLIQYFKFKPGDAVKMLTKRPSTKATNWKLDCLGQSSPVQGYLAYKKQPPPSGS